MVKKEAILLGVLAVLVVANMAALVLLMRLAEAVEAARPASSAAERPAVAAPGTVLPATRESADLLGRLNDIDARLVSLASEVRGVGERVGALPPGDSAPIAQSPITAGPGGGAAPPAASAGNSKIERMLLASQDVKKFWEEMNGLSGIRRGIDSAEYADLVLERTAAFLQLDPEKRRSFDEVMKRRIADFEALEKDQREASQRWSQLPRDLKPADKQTAVLEWQEINQKIQTRRSQFMQDSKTGLAEFLNDQDFRHKAFLGQLDNWFRYASNSSMGGKWEGY